MVVVEFTREKVIEIRCKGSLGSDHKPIIKPGQGVCNFTNGKEMFLKHYKPLRKLL